MRHKHCRRKIVVGLLAVIAATAILHWCSAPLAAQSPPQPDAGAKAEHDRLVTELKALRNQDDFTAAAGVAPKTLAAARRAFGDDAWQSVDARLAVAEIEAARKLSPEQLARLKEARLLMKQEAKLYADGKYAEALAAAQKAAVISRELFGEKNRDYLESLLEVAYVEQELDKLDDAESHYRRVIELLAGLTGKMHPAYGTALNELGTLIEWRGKPKEAIETLTEALEIRRATLGEHHFDYARTLNNLGNASRQNDELKLSEEYYRRALAVFLEQPQDPKLYVPKVQHNLALTLATQGRYREAEPLYRASLEAFRKALGERHPDPARVMQTMGLLYSTLGDFGQAEAYLRGAQDIIGNAFDKEHFRYAITLDGLAWVLKEEGNYGEAEKVAIESLRIWRKTRGEKSESCVEPLNSLGNIYRDQKSFEQADRYFRDALEIQGATKGKTNGFYATILQNIALTNDDQAKFDAAEPLYLEALKIYRDTGDEATFSNALVLSNFGLLRFHQGRAADAEQLYLQASTIFKQTVGERHPRAARTLRNLGDLKRAAGKPTEAEALYRAALESQMLLVDAAAMGQSERQQLAMAARFREYIDNYLTFAVESSSAVDGVYEFALRWKGAVFMRQRSQRALAVRPDLAPLAEQLRNSTQELSHLALAAPEKGQAEKRLRRIAELSTQQEELQRQLATKSQAFREAREPFRAETLRSALPPDALLVDYWEYDHALLPPAGQPGRPKIERRIAAFVLGRDKPSQLIGLGPAKSVRDAVDLWRKDFGDSEVSAKAGRDLRTQIWDPLEKYFQGAEFLLISPDGVMGTVPFGALPGKQADTYLLQEWPISVVPVPQSIPIILEEQRQYPEGKLLLLGNINYSAPTAPVEVAVASIDDFGTRAAARLFDGEVFIPIKYTKLEIEALESSYKAKWGTTGMTVLQEFAADERAFRKYAPQHRYVHIATHGFFAPAVIKSAMENPAAARGGSSGDVSGVSPGLLSGLALAGANRRSTDGDDGILTAEEAETLDLTKVDLVVLSACDTGLGEVAGGEGVLGLQRAFQVAGARTVVASMWQVNDEQTRNFMDRFYGNMWGKDGRERMKMLAAFREAQLWMLMEGPKDRNRDVRIGVVPRVERKTAAPYFWGAFVLSGDWR